MCEILQLVRTPIGTGNIGFRSIREWPEGAGNDSSGMDIEIFSRFSKNTGYRFAKNGPPNPHFLPTDPVVLDGFDFDIEKKYTVIGSN